MPKNKNISEIYCGNCHLTVVLLETADVAECIKTMTEHIRSEHFHDCREHETEFVEKKEPN